MVSSPRSDWGRRPKTSVAIVRPSAHPQHPLGTAHTHTPEIVGSASVIGGLSRESGGWDDIVARPTHYRHGQQQNCSKLCPTHRSSGAEWYRGSCFDLWPIRGRRRPPGISFHWPGLSGNAMTLAAFKVFSLDNAGPGTFVLGPYGPFTTSDSGRCGCCQGCRLGLNFQCGRTLWSADQRFQEVD